MKHIEQHTSGPVQPQEGLQVEFISVKEAVRIFGVSRSLIYDLILHNEIQSINLRRRGSLLGRRLIVVESLRNYMLSFSEGGSE